MNIELPSGRVIHAYDTGGSDLLPVFWHHGTPNTGEPPEPLFPAAERLGVRWVSYDRPGYGQSTRQPGRSAAAAAEDTRAVADALGLTSFAVMSHSGGGPHALACASLLPDRVTAAVCAATLAPVDAANLDWFEGMIPSGRASLAAALAGLPEKEHFETSGVEYDPEFSQADMALLSGSWGWLGKVAGHGLDAGIGGLVDDDIAYVNPWGFDPADIQVPLLLLHGGQDGIVPSSHSRWLADHCPTAELRIRPADGHISVLAGAESALEWLANTR